MKNSNIKELEIKKGIPIPPAATAQGPLSRAVGKMEIGDCVDVESANHCSALDGARKRGNRFVTRTLINGENKKFLRIWRVK